MKRLVFMIGFLLVSFQSFAQDIYISSWVELTDIALSPKDSIIKCDDIESEPFEMPEDVEPQEKIDGTKSTFYQSNVEQYPNAQIVRTSSVPVISERAHDVDYWEQAAQWNKVNSKDQPSKKYGSVNQSALRSDGIIEAPADTTREEYVARTGVRYCVEEDSWWKTSDRTRAARHLVLVPADQRGALWRTVTVIKPRVFWNGHKYADKFFTYEATEEYRLAGPLKIAALLGCLGVGLFAYAQGR